MDIIVLDTETTGIDHETDRLVELAGVSFRKLQSDFSLLVNPERDIPPEAMAIHHITPKDVLGAPGENEALRLFQGNFPEAGIYAAHNAKFDRKFLERIAGGPLPVSWICTYKAAITAWPEAPGHGNQVLRYWLGLDIEVPSDLFPHRALYDCIVTAGILERLLEKYSPYDLIEISSNPVLLKTVTFGKHKGKAWADVDYGYLKWVLGPTGLTDNEDALFTANHYIKSFQKR